MGVCLGVRVAVRAEQPLRRATGWTGRRRWAVRFWVGGGIFVGRGHWGEMK